MKLTSLLLSVSIISLASCTTAYKSGQTPDDVYFSPARPQDEQVKEDSREESRETARYNDEYYEDRYLRMRVRNRMRWSELDDWYYGDYRNRYNVYLGCCFCSNSWSPYSQWNSYYNPYYQHYIPVRYVKTPVYNRPRTFNLNAYNTGQQNTRSYGKVNSGSSGNATQYNSPRSSATNRDNGSGSRLRNLFRSNSSSSSSSSSSGSSGSSSSSSGSSSGSSSPSKAPVRRF